MDDKAQALDSLTAALDEFVAKALDEFQRQGIQVRQTRIDYMTDTVVMEIHEGEASVKKLNEIGIKMRQDWPAMPDVAASYSEGITEYPVLTFVMLHERYGA